MSFNSFITNIIISISIQIVSGVEVTVGNFFQKWVKYCLVKSAEVVCLSSFYKFINFSLLLQAGQPVLLVVM